MMKSRFENYILMAVLAIIFSSLWACTATQQDAAMSGATVAASAKAADYVLQSGDVERAVLSIEYQAEELQYLIDAFDIYSESRESLKGIVISPINMLSAQAVIQEEYSNLLTAYGMAQHVIASNADRYSEADLVRLKRWQTQARQLKVQYDNFAAALDAAATADARYARTIELLGIAAKFALMAA